jgi:hypothetical protein
MDLHSCHSRLSYQKTQCDVCRRECGVVGISSATTHHQEQQLAADQPSDTAPPGALLPCTPRASPAPLRRSTTFTPDKADQKIPTPSPSPPPQPPQNHRYPKLSLFLQDSNLLHHRTDRAFVLCSVLREEGGSPTEKQHPRSKRWHLNSSLSTVPSSAVSSSSVATLNNVSALQYQKYYQPTQWVFLVSSYRW